LNKRSGLLVWLCAALCCAVFLITGCGNNYYFAGRTLPPSRLKNRVLVAIQNPGAFNKGELMFVDAYYDIRHSYDDKIPQFSISGFGGAQPATIQNIPEHQTGAIYNSGDGSLVLADYSTEAAQSGLPGLSGPSSSIFITQDLKFVYAANQQSHVLTVLDRVGSRSYYLNLPGIFRISVNPAGTTVLAFVQNSNTVYSVVHLQANEPGPSNAVDCEPQNLPIYCVVPVVNKAGAPIQFDRPTKAVFSPDGSTAYVLNCGPECGGSQSSVSYLPTAGVIVDSGKGPIPPGSGLDLTGTVLIPGGATNALADGNTLYLAGQQLQPDGLFSGNLTVLDAAGQKVTGQYGIADGTHSKMILADDNTLWIGSTLCQEGERYLGSASTSADKAKGCLVKFDTVAKTVQFDSFKGDLTGLAAVTLLHKLYVAEGGQIHIYSTVDGHELDNSQVTVTGTVYDVAYMDAGSNGNNTTY